MSDSVWPHKWQSTRLPHPWDSPGNNIGVDCHFLLHCIKVKSESEVAQSCLTPSDPVDCSLPGSSTYQAPPSMGSSRQEYWSGVIIGLKQNVLERSWNRDVWTKRPYISAFVFPKLLCSKWLNPPALRAENREVSGWVWFNHSHKRF